MSQLATNKNIPLTFDHECIQELSWQYVQIALQLALNIKLKKEEIHISNNSLALAFAEAATDLQIMALRRQPKSGISLPKIAGILTFRLARFAPINLIGVALENDIALKLNELTALALSMKAIMHMDISLVESDHVTKELQYTLARRHMNQETLGLAFDILSKTKSSSTHLDTP